MRSGELAVCAGVERTAGDVSCRLLNFLEFARRPSSGRRWSPSVKTRIVFVFTQAAGPAPAVTHATARGVCWVHGHGPQLPKGLTLTANSVQNNTLMAVHAQ